MSATFVFRQLSEPVSCTYTYLLGCLQTKSCILIDPVIETVQRDLALIRELSLDLKFVANTHIHADHVTGTGELKRLWPGCKSILGNLASAAKADIYLEDNRILNVGNNVALEVRSTPGHTSGCVTYVAHAQKMAFTGDALLIRACGRTDFQEGNPAQLYESVHSRILSLPPDFHLYPAHDYKGCTVTTVTEELHHNPRLTRSKAEFIEIMNNLKLARPAQIDKCVPANLVCGILDEMDSSIRAQVDKSYNRPPGFSK